MSEQPPNEGFQDENGMSGDPEMDDKTRAGMDFLVSIADGRADERIKLFFDANWPVMMEAVADRVAEKIPIDQVAVKAEALFEQRWKREAAKRQAAADGAGSGGSNGHRPTESGGGGGSGGDDDLAFLNGVPDSEDGGQAASNLPVAQDRKQAAAIGGIKMLEDPLGTLERAANLVFDIMDRRRPQTPQRNDLDVIEDLASRRPWLIDTFASQDPQTAPQRLADAMAAGARSGLSVAEAWAKYGMRGAGKPPPTWKPPAIEMEPPAPPTTPPPAPAPVAAMAQDQSSRRRRRLQDTV